MPTTIIQGVSGSTSGGDYTDELKITKNAEIISRKDSNGIESIQKAINPTADISIKGGGNPAIATGSGGVAVAALNTGVIMTSKFEHTEKNSEFDDYSADAKHYPSGSEWSD